MCVAFLAPATSLAVHVLLAGFSIPPKRVVTGGVSIGAPRQHR
jgi:hypothetical protein